MKRIVLGAVLFLFHLPTKAQDTFSILAFDSITREVGAAGASCLDMFNFPQFTDHFICELFPDTGAVATQASYQAQNQAGARSRMRAGDSPSQLITWLNVNDVTGNPEIRQYGVVRMDMGNPRADAHTGVNCMNFKNHIIGPNYTIHGNILLGQLVLDSMEARFKREKGDLACKLMAAMQGAKMVGADTRCSNNGTSSLFAFLKISQPTDTFDKPSLLVSLKTHNGDGKEPIDSLQQLFDGVKDCKALFVGEFKNLLNEVQVYPNPSHSSVHLKFQNFTTRTVSLLDIYGVVIAVSEGSGDIELAFKDVAKGVYFVRIEEPGLTRVRKLFVD